MPSLDADDQQQATARTRRRFARRQWARRWLSWRYVAATLLVVALVGGAVWLVLFSRMMQVQDVEVSGNHFLSDGEVREVADIGLGEQLALVDLDHAARRVGALREVRSVDVVRHWPDTVEVVVEERVAIAVVEQGGRWNALDSEGVVFRHFAKAPADLPRVQASTAVTGDALKEAATVVSALPGDLASRVDHVEVETIDQITLVMRGGRRVVWGSSEESAQKAEVIAVLLQGEGQVFDVSVPGSPTAR